MAYFSHDTETKPEVVEMGNVHNVDTEEEAWKEVGDTMWDWWKGEGDEVIRRHASLYSMPPSDDEDDYVEPEDVDISKCVYVGTRSFCIPPHAPECNGGMVKYGRHEWDERALESLGDSEWKGCRDAAVPCSHCDTLKIMRMSDEPINNSSRRAIVRYEPRPILEGAVKMVLSEPKDAGVPPSQDGHSRICGVTELFHEYVILFKADDDDTAVKIAQGLLRECFDNDESETAWIKYYVAVAPPGTKLTDELYQADLTSGKYILQDTMPLEPAEPACAGESHEWSQEARAHRTWPDCYDAVKYCTVQDCNAGKVIRVYPDETSVDRYVTLAKRDVLFKDGL